MAKRSKLIRVRQHDYDWLKQQSTEHGMMMINIISNLIGKNVNKTLTLPKTVDKN